MNNRQGESQQACNKRRAGGRRHAAAAQAAPAQPRKAARAPLRFFPQASTRPRLPWAWRHRLPGPPWQTRTLHGHCGTPHGKAGQTWVSHCAREGETHRQQHPEAPATHLFTPQTRPTPAPAPPSTRARRPRPAPRRAAQHARARAPRAAAAAAPPWRGAPPPRSPVVVCVVAKPRRWLEPDHSPHYKPHARGRPQGAPRRAAGRGLGVMGACGWRACVFLRPCRR